MLWKLILLVPLVVAAAGQCSYAGLVAYWNLEEGSGTTTTAAVGSPQADGKLVGATWITTGLAPIDGATAAVFFKSAGGDRIETSYPGVLGQAARSVTAWIRAEPTQANNAVMVGWGANTNDQRYSFRINKTAADGLLNAIRLEIQGSRSVATTPVTDRQWHHVAVTHGAGAHIGEVSFYVDGKLDAISGTAGGAVINTASTSVVLGNSGHATGTYGFDGALDEVRIYDHVLTQTEIEAIMKGAAAGQAREPKPASKAADVPADVVLSWTAGRYPATHDVYLATTLAQVSDADRTDTTGLLAGKGQTATTFAPAGRLAYGQTYYWRIDEVNTTADNTIFKGNVWSFTVEPYAYPVKPASAIASSAQANMGPEKTIDGSGLTGDLHGTDLTTMWLSNGTPPNWIQYQFDKVYKLSQLSVWNSNQLIESAVGFGARNVTVETSTDGTTWTALSNVPEFAKAPGATGYAANTMVNMGSVSAQYVKLTINSSWGGPPVTGLSEVRFFYVPVQVRVPQPADAATGVSVGAGLSWRPGREAASHKVFFGTDPNAVAHGTAAAKTVADCVFDPGTLVFGTKYYWRVDEVNTVTYPGDVWSFTTQEFAVVDDFESYNDKDNCIFDAWIDGYTDGKSGSQVGYLVAPFAEQTVFHGGKQSMPMEYNNVKPPFYSETTRDLGSPQDWTGNGATHLGLWFRGYPAVTSVAVAEVGGKMTLTGDGTDIWNACDDFVFAYKTLTGDGSMAARVVNIGAGTNTWAKGGVMIRDSLNGGSTYVNTVLTANSDGTAGNGACVQWRPTANSATGLGSTAATTVIKPPCWVKIDRKGDSFTGYLSADGKTWTQLGTSQTLKMADPVYIGICVTAHQAGQQRTFDFDSISSTGGVTGAWQGAQINAPRYNNAASLYAIVEDSSGKSKLVTHPDPAAAATGAWTLWPIPLSDLTAAGVKTTRVKKLTIGVGDRNSPKPGATGMLYLDDIGFGHPLP